MIQGVHQRGGFFRGDPARRHIPQTPIVLGAEITAPGRLFGSEFCVSAHGVATARVTAQGLLATIPKPSPMRLEAVGDLLALAIRMTGHPASGAGLSQFLQVRQFCGLEQPGATPSLTGRAIFAVDEEVFHAPKLSLYRGTWKLGRSL